MPTMSASAISVIRLSVKPSRYMTRRVLIMDVGMDRTMMRTLRHSWRNRSVTRPTRKMASNRSVWTARRDSRMYTEASFRTSTSAPAGRAG